ESRSRKSATRHVTEGPGRWQQEGIRIEIPAGFLEPVHSKNYLSCEIGIYKWNVGNPRIAISALIDANHRRHGEAALRVEDAIQLPVADQLVHESGGAAPESAAVSER